MYASVRAGWTCSSITIDFSICEGVLGHTSNSFKVGGCSRAPISISIGGLSFFIGDEMAMAFLDRLSGVGKGRASCRVFGTNERGEISLRLRSTGEGVVGGL